MSAAKAKRPAKPTPAATTASSTTASSTTASLTTATLDRLDIEDEASFAQVPFYGALRAILVGDGYRFSVLPKPSAGRWDRALFLNLTFWGHRDGGDVLVDHRLPADVVTHVGWHHLAAHALSPKAKPDGKESAPRPPTAEALFLGEAIASAFDVYMVGRLLGRTGSSSFLTTQVPAMADAAEAAGLSADKFEAMLGKLAADPEGSFESLRALLFEVTCALAGCSSAAEGYAVLARYSRHRFAALLHRYELSNWVLYARAYASKSNVADRRAIALHETLAAAPSSLEWLGERWVEPALARVLKGAKGRANPARRSDPPRSSSRRASSTSASKVARGRR